MGAKQVPYLLAEARFVSLVPSAPSEAPPSLRRVSDALDTPPPPRLPPPSPLHPLLPRQEIPASALRPNVPTHAIALLGRYLSANTVRGVVFTRTVPSGVLATEGLNFEMLERLSTEETSGGDNTTPPPPPPTQRGRPLVMPAEAFPFWLFCGVAFSLA